MSLQGNAFFDVAKKQGQPFWIDTEQAKIEVLGTAFSVQSDENAPFRLSVQRGIVKVTLKKGNQECYVKAGEMVVVRSQRLVVLDTDNENEEWGSFFKMKQSYHYLSVLLILFFFVDMMRADGSDVLERIVRLPKIKGTVYSLLSDVSQQSGYMFIYDSKVIDNDAVVKIKGGERSIRQAVYDIVGDTGLEFQVIGTHILITLPSEKKIHIHLLAV